MLTDLLADIQDLQLLLGRRHTAMTLRHTTRLIAQMAGLLSLTLLKLNDLPSSRKWTRTARVEAAEAEDPPPAPGSGVEWTTDRDNLEARAFYRQVGAPAATTKVMYRLDPGDDLEF